MLRHRDTKGFTLIELLVVVGIIGLLSSVVLVAVFSGRSRARDGRRKADVKQLQAAVELYANASNGLYPEGGTDGTAVQVSKSTSPSCTPNATFEGKIVPVYLPVSPQTPPGSDCYYYIRAVGGIAYKIKGKLENGDDNDGCNDGGNQPVVGTVCTSATANWFEVFGGPGSNTLP